MTPLFLLGIALSIICVSTGTSAQFPTDFRVGRIVGGEDTTIEEYPHQIALLKKNVGHWCGGSILSANWILSASHCVDGLKPGFLRVCAGATKLKCEDSKTYVIKRIIMHPDYNRKGAYDMDFSLIELAEPLPLEGNPKMKAIRLATTTPEDGVWATVTGWGALRSGGALPKVLQKVDIPIIDRNRCLKYYGGGITNNMICAGFEAGKKDSCQGDSGGPLIIKEGDEPVQVGVVSWGIGCAGPKKPGVYANVPKAIEWINKVTQL